MRVQRFSHTLIHELTLVRTAQSSHLLVAPSSTECFAMLVCFIANLDNNTDNWARGVRFSQLWKKPITQIFHLMRGRRRSKDLRILLQNRRTGTRRFRSHRVARECRCRRVLQQAVFHLRRAKELVNIQNNFQFPTTYLSSVPQQRLFRMCALKKKKEKNDFPSKHVNCLVQLGSRKIAPLRLTVLENVNSCSSLILLYFILFIFLQRIAVLGGKKNGIFYLRTPRAPG